MLSGTFPIYKRYYYQDKQIVFLKMGQSRPLFVYFRVTISIQIEKTVDGVLGIRTRGRRMHKMNKLLVNKYKIER